MNQTEKNLKKETEKWLKKLEDKVKKVKITDPKAKNSMENIHAYIKDSKHFAGKNDFINAFEAVIYAFGILETCERMGMVE